VQCIPNNMHIMVLVTWCRKLTLNDGRGIKLLPGTQHGHHLNTLQFAGPNACLLLLKALPVYDEADGGASSWQQIPAAFKQCQRQQQQQGLQPAGCSGALT